MVLPSYQLYFFQLNIIFGKILFKVNFLYFLFTNGYYSLSCFHCYLDDEANVFFFDFSLRVIEPSFFVRVGKHDWG